MEALEESSDAEAGDVLACANAPPSPCSFGHPVRARPSSVCIHACLSICNDLGLFSPRAARNRQGFGDLPPKNARVRLGMRALLVVLGKKRSQRAEICRFMLCYQDIFVITKHSNARLESRTRTRAIFGSKQGQPH